MVLTSYCTYFILQLTPKSNTRKYSKKFYCMGRWKCYYHSQWAYWSKSGTLEISDGKLTGGTFEVDMTSITNLDVSEAYREDENHLKSEDFFDAKAFPSSHLVIIKTTALKKICTKCDLTIRNIKKTIEFDATLKPNGNVFKATANFSLTVQNLVKHRSGSFFMNLATN